MQNYEKVKQAMLANESTNKAIFVQKLGEKTRQSQVGISNFMARSGVGANLGADNKKRNIEAVELPQGRFRLNFKEGHSKNFKREVEFNWFMWVNNNVMK